LPNCGVIFGDYQSAGYRNKELMRLIFYCIEVVNRVDEKIHGLFLANFSALKYKQKKPRTFPPKNYACKLYSTQRG